MAPSYSSNKLEVFNHPDSDDPVAQTLYKMIEPDDKVILLIDSVYSVIFTIKSGYSSNLDSKVRIFQ